jgi:hypothetical protein
MVTEGKPITAFLITALVLWALYLWKHNRLGKPGLLPHPADVAPKPAVPPIPGGWRPGTPPVDWGSRTVPPLQDVPPSGNGSVLG